MSERRIGLNNTSNQSTEETRESGEGGELECTNRSSKILVALWLLGITSFGCSAQKAPPATDEAMLTTPTKDILVTDGDLNKSYDILGEVECTLTGKSVYSTNTSLSGGASPEVTKEAKDMLRKVAYTKYGDKVDAIINSKVSGGTQGGFWGMLGGAYGAPTGIVNAQGIAISFKKEAETPPPASQKRAAKQRKSP